MSEETKKESTSSKPAKKTMPQGSTIESSSTTTHAVPPQSIVSAANENSTNSTASLTPSKPSIAESSNNNTNNNNNTIDESISDVLEERLIDAEYKIWKKNTPYLYDVVMTHSLEWPSLTCQWLPMVKKPDGQPTEEHSLLLGTHTTGEQNYLIVASVTMPKSEDNVVVPVTSTSDENTATHNEKEVKQEESKEPEKSTNSTAHAEKKDASHINETTSTTTSKDSTNKEIPTPTTTTTSSNSAIVATPIAHYDDERNEVGGFGFTPSISSNIHNTTSSTISNIHNNMSTPGKIDIRMKIKHLGEVNRARYMPQNHFIVATRGPDPELYIFDLSKHSSFPDEDSLCAPQCVCVGHEKEGYGLAWSPLKEGMLLSGSEDKTVNLWNANHLIHNNSTSGSTGSDNNQINPDFTFLGHTDAVEDVAWHAHDANMVGSVGDDRSIMLWDIRQPKAIHLIKDAHAGDINSIAFNPLNEFLFATGSADKTVALWDLRNVKTKMQSLIGHNDQIYQVSWAPFNEAILASCCADRRVNVWDLSRIGDEQTPEDAEDGPPELLFMHGGHTSKVCDFSWNSNDIWTIASVAEDNVLQVWNMAEEIYAGGDDEDEDEEGLLGEDDIES